MLKYYLASMLAVVLTSFCQLLLKVGAMHGKSRASVVRLYLNPYTVTAWCLLLVVTVLSAWAFKHVPLKAAVFLLPMGLILVAALSYAVLGERFCRTQALGALLILAGTVVFNL